MYISTFAGMQLVIRFSADKPSRIGIRFIYEFLAIKPYESMVNAHGIDNYSVTLEPLRGLLNLTLRSEGDGAKFEYRELEFKADQVMRLKQLFHSGFAIEFVHVYPKENRLFVAKPFRQERFIRVTAVRFVGMD
jgi:hypothetical protein